MASRQFWILFGTIAPCPNVLLRFLSRDWLQFAPAQSRSNWWTGMCPAFAFAFCRVAHERGHLTSATARAFAAASKSALV